jgi:CheY-like chemotaxis protein
MAEDRVTILVIDDDPGHVELVRRHLRRAGIDTPFESVADGTRALERVRRRDMTGAGLNRLLILLDLNITGSIDGFEVLRQIKAHPNTRHVPVIVLTTADDPWDVDRCYQLGCNLYVTKPVDPAAFSEHIERLGRILSIASLPISGTESAS